MTVEMSIEDQIADVYVIPAPGKRICAWEPRPGYPACTTPLARSNREPLCYRHTQLERTLKTIKDFSRKTEPDDPYAFPKQLRLCAVKDCNRKLMETNATGRCTRHYYVTQGMQMKDGSIPRPLPIAPTEPIAPIEPLAPIQPLEPIAAEKEEMTPVTTETATEDPKHFRTCAVKDCEEAIGVHNSSGRCTGHFYIKRGMVMKDGSIPKPHTPLSATMKRAKIKNAAAGITGKNKHKKALPAPTVFPPDFFEPPAVTVATDHVSLKVPIEAIDRFLLNMSLEDKTRIVEREIFGGA